MSSHAPKNAGLELRQEQQMSRLQVQRANEIVHSQLTQTAQQIHLASLRILNERRENQNNAYHQLLTGKNIHAIASRIARDVIFDLAHEGISLFYSPNAQEGNLEQRSDIFDEKIHQRFDHWWRTRFDYVPDGKTQAQSLFYTKHPEARPIFKANRELVASTEAKGNSLFSEMKTCLEYLDMQFQVDPEGRRIFDRVRNATYDVMNASNIHELLPKIARAYHKDWLKPETLLKLADNDPDQLEKYTEEVSKGIFVFGFDEKVNGKPSIREQMEHDFTREYEPNEPQYKGRYLLDDSGEILAWFTYWENQGSGGEKYTNMIWENLLHGATGGTMNYKRKPNLTEFEPFLQQTFLIDTIQGLVPGAAARLFAKALLEVYEHDPSLRYFVGYRLHELHMDPPFEAFNEPISFHNNIGSGKFFGSRKCATMADDYNENGPASERILNGKRTLLRPEWDWFNGKFIQVLRAAWRHWQMLQRMYVDMSSDGYNSSLVERNRPTITAI